MMTSEPPQGWRLLCTPGGHPLYYSTSDTPLLPAPSPPPPTPVTQAVSRRIAAAPRSRELPPPSRYILPTLVENTRAKAKGYPVFEVERDRVLQINLGGSHDSFAWIKAGTVIARRGTVKFTRQGFREQGAGLLVKKAVTGEGLKLVQCKGSGIVYCADDAKAVSVIELRKQTIYVNSPNVLALSSSLRYEFKLLSNAGMAASGLLSLKISGLGFLSVTSLKGAIMMTATPDDPLYSKPDATVAWTHHPSFTVDLSPRLLTGRATGQEVQLKFTHGFVIIQPLPKHLSLLSDRAATVGAGGITLALNNLFLK
ncbi:hypothetical protein BWQ96_00368 [Gracilariopsis chorda]|uniref:Uncharacterized protein n=1 Tax=Gracilariopsis chorda TaxID=448386 RepID=A0A2V3J5K9_9FLOR|nr:hypothetical protein BWQ96_00368 [Gracilariopsis chorda]|eukprot:PXF49716.1 hypothetical protein BWQ96_00368 [Gracilariopsis chorda]